MRDIKERRDLETGLGGIQVMIDCLIDHIRLSIGQPLYIYLYLVPFSSYLALNNIVTLKSELEITQNH